MATGDLEGRHGHSVIEQQGLDITVRTGSGEGQTTLSAFDRALQHAGVADFNLITLSSVIPAGSRIRTVDAPLRGRHGDALFCVRAQAFAERPGDVVWAGLGWCTDASGGGLFVEHRGDSEADVMSQIELSLADMNHHRGGGYGPPQMALASAVCVDVPACALVLAAYRVSSWHDAHAVPPPVEPARTEVGRRPESRPEGLETATEPAPGAPGAPSQDRSRAPSRITTETHVDRATAVGFYRLYREAFSELETQAVARQVLHESEFFEEMADPRVIKYVAWNDDGEAIGISTLTAELSAVPWISPAYFEHHYPEHYARGAVYYLGFTLVHPAYRGLRTYQAMFAQMSDIVIGGRAVVAWDICSLNDERGFMRNGAEFVEKIAEATIEVVDRQSYFVGTFFGPLEKSTNP